MKKDRNYLIHFNNATSTDDGNGELETYEEWLERQLLSRIERLEQYDKQIESESKTIGTIMLPVIFHDLIVKFNIFFSPKNIRSIKTIHFW